MEDTMKKFLQSIKDWYKMFTTSYDWELERYLSQSTDAADLEYRMLRWERERCNRQFIYY